jgi:hypothetical protein
MQDERIIGRDEGPRRHARANEAPVSRADVASH